VPRETCEVVDGTGNILELCARCERLERFNYVSDEQDPPHGAGAYGAGRTDDRGSPGCNTPTHQVFRHPR
jgi:hypothetical protein